MAQLRQGPSGPPIVGNNVGDTLIWDGNEWLPGAGSGLPPGTAVGQLLQWDGANWILVADGANNGDVLTWNNATQEWEPAASPAGQTAWDFIITQKSDFPAPVAGVIDLTSGSYAIKNPIDLGADRLRIDANVDVLMKGMGDGKLLESSNATCTIEVDGGGFLQLETLRIDNSVSNAVNIAANASMEARNNDYGGQVDGVVCNGALRDMLSTYSGSGRALALLGGLAFCSGCRFLGGNDHALEILGASVQDGDFNQCQFSNANVDAVEINSSDANVRFTDCTISCTVANGDCVHISLGSTLTFVGGMMNTDQANRGNGINIDGNIAGGLQVIGVSAEAISTGAGEGFIHWTSGVVRRAQVIGCNTASTVSVAIDWPSANIPTTGLSIVGNTFDTGTPFNGFTAASARVNSKANQGNAGLLTETAIVP